MERNALITLTAACFLSGALHAQMQRIVLQGSGEPQVFTDIAAAVSAAQPNDKLYFSGGAFIATAGFTIDMPLHFIGAGVHPDSTNVTSTTEIATTTGSITITTDASGSTFTGIAFNAAAGIQYGSSDTDDNPTDILFQRCRLMCPVTFTQDGFSTSSTTFDECIVNESFNGGVGGPANTTSATFTRCVFGNAPGTGTIGQVGNLFVSHCVFLTEEICRNSEGAVIENSICTLTSSAPVYQSNNVIMNNCLFSAAVYTGNSSGEVITDCQLNVPTASIFVNETDNAFQFTDDLHLAPGSGGVGGAEDGTDIGIYGSSSPAKAGNVPYNPHYRQANIATATDANGDLPVTIQVATQPN